VTFGDGPCDWNRILEVACAADLAGIDRLLVSDHLAFDGQLDDCARSELGAQAAGLRSRALPPGW